MVSSNADPWFAQALSAPLERIRLARIEASSRGKLNAAEALLGSGRIEGVQGFNPRRLRLLANGASFAAAFIRAHSTDGLRMEVVRDRLVRWVSALDAMEPEDVAFTREVGMLVPAVTGWTSDLITSAARGTPEEAYLNAAKWCIESRISPFSPDISLPRSLRVRRRVAEYLSDALFAEGISQGALDWFCETMVAESTDPAMAAPLSRARGRLALRTETTNPVGLLRLRKWFKWLSEQNGGALPTIEMKPSSSRVPSVRDVYVTLKDELLQFARNHLKASNVAQFFGNISIGSTSDADRLQSRLAFLEPFVEHAVDLVVWCPRDYWSKISPRLRACELVLVAPDSESTAFTVRLDLPGGIVILPLGRDVSQGLEIVKLRRGVVVPSHRTPTRLIARSHESSAVSLRYRWQGDAEPRVRELLRSS
jgi:hypothetical protein